jgi:cytochrome P450
MERIVPSSGLHAHGTHIPAGTIVSVCQHTVHRDTHVYGAEIEDFRPERWLVDDVEAVKKMDRTLIAVSLSELPAFPS